MPVELSLTTVVASLALLGGLCAIVFLTWRNAQATGSIGQLLHRTEKATYHGEIDPRRFSERDRD